MNKEWSELNKAMQTQIKKKDTYQEHINSPIITTGNELVKQQIADFSGQLNLQELYSYILAVKDRLRG